MKRCRILDLFRISQRTVELLKDTWNICFAIAIVHVWLTWQAFRTSGRLLIPRMEPGLVLDSVGACGLSLLLGTKDPAWESADDGSLRLRRGSQTITIASTEPEDGGAQFAAIPGKPAPELGLLTSADLPFVPVLCFILAGFSLLGCIVSAIRLLFAYNRKV